MKKILFILTFLLLSVNLMAQLSENDALSVAADFLKGKHAQSDEGRRGVPFHTPRMTAALVNNGVYAVNMDEGGYVLVANSMITDAVLGYSDSGHCLAEELPYEVRAWLQSYADQIEQMETEARGEPRRVRVVTAKSAIPPLLTSKWNQGTASATGNVFNWMCPLYSGKCCMTGCVATAMAQVMYFHKYPDYTTSIPGYISNSSLGELPDLPATSFDWTNMQDEYTGSDLTSLNTPKADAIGKLMKYCGYGCQMNYGTGSSAANTTNMVYALVKYFKYDVNTSRIIRNDYSLEDWENIIYNELKNGRPILYGGKSTGGGHQFVCDGYDGDGLFHINWGWGGNYNGYFLLTLLNPRSSSGAGASSTRDGYTVQQDAVIRLQPPTGKVLQSELSLFGAKDDGTTFHFSARNRTVDVLRMYAGVCATDEDGNMKMVWQGTRLYELDTNSGWSDFTVNRSTLNLSSLSNGTYRMTMAYKLDGTSKWVPCQNSENHYLTVVVKNKAIASVTTTDLDPQLSIVGGTIYGGARAGESQEIVMTFKNDGEGEYTGTVFMRVDNEANYTCMAGVSIPPHRSADAYFYFTPPAAGAYKLHFWQGNYSNMSTYEFVSEIGTRTANIKDASSRINVNFLPDNIKEIGTVRYLTTPTTSGKITLTNNGTTTLSIPKLKLDGYGSSWTYSSTNVEPGNTNTLNLPKVTLTPGKQYTWILTDNAGNELGQYAFYYGNGIFCYKGDGTATYRDMTSNISLDAAITSVDMRNANLSTLSKLTNSNPNCLFYISNSQSSPSALSGKNVIVGNRANSVSLTYGYDYGAIEEFTANSISFTRSFKGVGLETGGWHTMLIPFTATSVKTGNKSLSWFTSTEDSGKNFWLYRFVEEYDGRVVFGYAGPGSVTENTPYIISVPDNTWGEDWNLDGKTITFSATNARVQATPKSNITGGDFKMIGTFHAVKPDAGFVLNAAGDGFAKINASTSVNAFDAYFLDVSPTGTAFVTIPILTREDIMTAIETISSAEPSANDEWYSLQGVRISRPTSPGIYIHNGKKIMISN